MYGDRIRMLRKEKKLTMKKFGEKFNLAESTISGYENETRKPDIQIINKFADFFGVNADYLLGRSDNPTPSVNSQTITDNEVYIAYLGGPPEEMNEEEAEHLKEQLAMFRSHKEKRRREREQEKENKK